ncbi:pirin family protein [Afifella pfennigii]|uniref:pirin family protein n=1 Tax=Afifella pfennigii TaxID=209897 RepID=UPI00047DFBD0|nr:pirin family protein [Afifella pfennigii]
MIDIRSFDSLGGADHGWLRTKHHFSFADYHDPERVHWGALRVWNDDTIAPQEGFPRHPHRDMEIVTYVRQGAITHRDHLGNEGRTVAGDVQVMSAGSGIAHEEWNLEDGETQIFQIWILPAEKGGEPRWASASFPKAERAGQLVPLASGKGENDTLLIRQDATLYGATLTPGQELRHGLVPGRYVYLVPASGSVTVNGKRLETGDGAAIRDEAEIVIAHAGGKESAEIVLADVPRLR